ncbi:MAG: FAD-dependent oxidoreductase [Clostridia bacterium]|nr:FAD-dependent oxidoreductase [Clostridia bacterium]
MSYDVLVIGGGPAGITAAIYAKRAGREVAVVERYVPGGQLNLIGEIENYTGFSKIDGAALAYNMYQHARKLEVPFIIDEIVDVDLECDEKILKGKKDEYNAKAIIIAGGSYTKELNIEGEQKFKGRGVSYCALCDGNFFKEKVVAVVGSGDSAFSDTQYLSSLCKHVYLLTKENLKLHNYAENAFDDTPNVTILRGAISQKIEGDESVEKLFYKTAGIEECLNVDGVFVAIGRTPDTKILDGKIDLTERGYIKTDDKMQTSKEGVYACGDIRESQIKQIATAVGDGAMAGTEASKYVLRQLYTKK